MRSQLRDREGYRLLELAVVATTVVLIVGVLIGAVPDQARAGRGRCVVKNGALNVTYTSSGGSSLWAAIRDARSGNKLKVRGRCAGSYKIAKDLTLVGTRTRGATLDGRGHGTVLLVSRGDVTITNVKITGGDRVAGGGTYSGSGIVNFGTVTLNGSSRVEENKARRGGGIVNLGDLYLHDSASVTSNRAGRFGGGLYNYGTLALSDSSSVSGNRAGVLGGGIYNDGILVGAVAGGNVAHNSPDDIAP